MDFNYIKNLLRKDIKSKSNHLSNEIVDEYLNLTFFRSSWIIYNDKAYYLIGIAEGKYDFYWICLDENDDIQLISCAISLNKNKEKDDDFSYFTNEHHKEADYRWRKVREKIKNYFNNNPNDKIIYFEDHVLDDEHIVYDNEEKTEYHIEKIK